MLSYTELKPGKVIVIDDEPCEIVWSSGIVKKQRQKPHNTVKMKNLVTGATLEKTFTQADKIEEAELDKKPLKFIYAARGKAVFANPDNPKERFEFSQEELQDKLLYIKEGAVVDALLFDDEIIGFKLPIKVDLEVVEAPPNIKGNTAQGGTKTVVVETGLKVTTPLFIEVGDIIRVNTETGEYTERV